METLTLSRKELHRPGLIQAACAGRITNRQAAEALGLSVRQVRRLKRRYEAGGAAALGHGSRGRPSPRRWPAAVRDEVIRLMTTRYVGFNDSHLTEKLREHHGLALGRESVRRLRRHLGLPAQRPRRPPRARRRRVPESARGALVQIDGSPFAWLQTRGPELMLLGAVDDATTDILALHFRPTGEDVHGYATLFHQVFTRHGLPLAIYGDRLNLLVRNDRHWSLEEQLAGTQQPTHLGRMLQDLGVGYIAAHSPQAKGRIERLWATLQDRLVSELRLRGVASVAAAEAYLPEFITDFNRRFGKPPAAPHPVWRRPPRDLPLLLSCRYPRRVARDNTVRLGLRWVQLRGRSYAGVRVEARELLDGRLVVCHAGRLLAEAPPPTGTFILKPHRAPSAARSAPRPAGARNASPPLRPPRRTPPTHTGRHPLPTHPWTRSYNPQRQGRTFSRSSKGGHFH